MTSRIIGKLPLDPGPLRADLATIQSFPRIEEAYDEFSSGYWKNCSLWNASGEAEDTTYRDISGSAQQTEYGKRLPYLSRLVHESFDMSRVTMVRARNLIDAMVVPHRDFVELGREKNQYFRLFIVLEDNHAALHSDEQAVFRMRPGEVWFLDAASVHAAVNFSQASRQSICVDFVFDEPFRDSDVFADQSLYHSGIAPDIIARPPLEPGLSSRLSALGSVLTADNLKDVLFLLSKIYFRRDASITSTYDWLVIAAQSSGDRSLVAKAEELQRYMVEKRSMDERFTLAAA